MLERYNPFRRAVSEKEKESSYSPLSLWADWDQWPDMGFCRSFQLPSTVDTSSVEAKFENAVLTVEVPKTEESKARKIKIKVK